MADSYRRGGRDRERDGPKDDNVEYFGGGESYRPGGHSGQGPYRPPHANRDTWNSNQRERERAPPRERDPRRDREDIDSYIPPTSTRARKDSPSPGFRPRSRSPPPRDRGDLFPDHTRSPARRYSPRRDDRPRSPPRRRSRSPISRDRSPPRRTRDYSPPRSPRRGRSPRFDRARSPRRNYSPPRDARRYSRSRSPRKNAYNDDNWRRRSPSPRSSVPSRRSSPPLHPDRVSVTGSAQRSPAYYGTPPRDPRPNGDFAPPTGPGGTRNGYDRPPPSGPSRGFSSSQTPPTGPRGPSNIPTQPRGARPEGPRRDFPDGPRRDFPEGPRRDFNPAMRGRTSLTYRAPIAPRAANFGEGSAPPTGPSGTAPPSGPRASSYSSRGDYATARASYPAAPTRQDYQPFRSTNTSSSSTYPRTQRFNSTAQYLQTTEKIIPGGKLLPSGLSAEQERKMKQLEQDAERLRADIEEKQAAKREVLGEWDVRERESQRESYRSELAEEGLKKLAGEEKMAAF